MWVDLREPAIVTSLIAAAISALSLGVVALRGAWIERNSAYFGAFASGALIATAILHLLPEAMNWNPMAPLCALGGYVFLYVLRTLSDGEQAEGRKLSAAGPVIGIGMHSFLDGLVYSVSFAASFFTGVVTSIGLVLHKFTEGVILFILLRNARVGKLTSFGIAFLFASLLTPAGAILSNAFIDRIDNAALGAGLAASAGALIFVGATHLAGQQMDSVKPTNRMLSALFLLLGMMVSGGFLLVHDEVVHVEQHVEAHTQ